MFVSQYLWIAFVPNSFFWYNVSDDFDSCEVNPHIWPFCFVTQFSLLGGELWFGVLSVDIHMSLTNPFASYTTYANYYAIAVYAIALFTATLLVCIVPIQYGLSPDPMLWVNVDVSSTKVNWTKIFLFYSFMGVIYLYCGYMAWWARSQIYKGLKETLSMRTYSVNKQTNCKYLFRLFYKRITSYMLLQHLDVIGYFLFWTLVFVLQFLNYCKATLNDGFFSEVVY